ncbi:precorrin-2 C(20)-methyltransferase [Acetobacter fabarum]|uniref:precorrin-2 C(20)-methyltransferase n=1 Tax=Acetobacter fabarum TaxID=483199 RepID=UPI00209EA419|nr:precorrin-2 C(20)-methyltransferase [Acetobacter fabarum]MCP1234331.1 precorrin-2 C(20)-methyltransferase [Acetobacter fabarum]
MMAGTLSIVGVGPGDPELITLRAARLIGSAPVVAYFCREKHPSQARTIAQAHINPATREMRLIYPFTTEVSVNDPAYHQNMSAFYDQSAERLAEELATGNDVTLLCEGDPFLYGSAMYVFDRLQTRCQTQVVPGIMAMNGCWAQAHAPMTHGDDVLCVLPATLPETELADWLERADAAVIMKIGRNMPHVRQAITRSGRMDEAVYVERGTQGAQVIAPMAEQDGKAPYFSLVLLPGRKRVR